MKASAIALLEIFAQKMRLEVPLFQRQYVWNKDQQWEPLWGDIARKFTEYLEGRKEAPVHFLGAMVLDQKQTPVTHVFKRQVIDGQQRLTTLQIFLVAFRDFSRERGCEELAKESDAFILNKGMMTEPEVDKYKVWPTQLDRAQFMDVIGAGSRGALEEKHPLVKVKYTRKYYPRPRMVEAYLFFHDQLGEFFLGSVSEPPLAANSPLNVRLDECFQALKNALLVAVIDLDPGDDAQVIFETLNARGEPLLPADLLRNYIFLRAARLGEPQEALYKEFWSRFDDPFWRHEVRQGRLFRPRSDLFIQHFLSSRQATDIPIKHLFVEYKFWIEKSKPYKTVREELATIARQGDDFRRLISPQKDDVLSGVANFLSCFDIGTAYPLLLFLMDRGLKDHEWREVSNILESYLLRRAVCGLTNKNYNRIFLLMIKTLQRDSVTPESVRAYLSGITGESQEWPSDAAFQKSWEGAHAYYLLNNPRIVHMLRRISDTYRSNRTEEISFNAQPSVEHLMPQTWLDNWPLSDGSKGMTVPELQLAEVTDPRAMATRARHAIVQTFGNLTLVTDALNSSVSNSAWSVKKPKLLYSLLPINQQLHSYGTWDEATIAQRSKELFSRALKVWPGPKAR